MKRIETLFRSRARENTLVVLFFLALSIVFTWPLALHAWSGLLGGKADNVLNTWIISWDARTIFSHPTQLFQANIMYPCRDVLTYSEHLFTLGLLAAPVYFVTRNPIFAYNFVLLLGFVLSGCGCYFLIKELTRSRWGALAGGVFFAFFPFKISQLCHIHVIFSAFLPFMLLYLHRYLERGRPRDLVLFGAFLLAQSLVSWHYLLYAAITALLYFAWKASFSRRKKDLARLAAVMGVMILAAAAILPFVLPYLRTHARLPDFVRSLEDTRGNSAHLADYLNVLPESYVYRYMPFTRLSFMGSELILFPGLAVPVLALCAFVVRRREDGDPAFDRASYRREALFFLLLSLLGVLLTMGPKIGGVANLLYTIPYRIGLFKMIRVPSRFFILVALGMAVLAGYGVANINARLSGTEKGARLFRHLSLLILVVLVLELFVFSLDVYSLGAETPAVYSWLNEQEEVEIIELPTDYADFVRQGLFVYYSTDHWQRTANGFSGYHPRRSRTIFEEMRGFPSRRSVDLLRGLGIDYVIWHREFLDAEAARALDERIREQPGLEVERDFGDQVVLRVLPAASASVEDLEATLVGESAGPARSEGGFFLHVKNPVEAAFVAVDEDPQPFTLRYHDRAGALLDEVAGHYEAPFFLAGGDAVDLSLGLEGPPPEDARGIEVKLTGGVLEGRTLYLDL